MIDKINGRTPEDIKMGLECYNCGECSYSRKNNNGEARCDDVEADALALIQRLELLQSRWISVNDKLPEDDLPENSNVKSIKVLVAIKGKTGIVMRTQLRRRRLLYDTRSEPFLEWEWSYSAGKVTHWMNLPELPEEN